MKGTEVQAVERGQTETHDRRDDVPVAADPVGRVASMALGGALSLLSTWLRGAWGWTAALAGGALVKGGVTGQPSRSTASPFASSARWSLHDATPHPSTNPGASRDATR